MQPIKMIVCAEQTDLSPCPRQNEKCSIMVDGKQKPLFRPHPTKPGEYVCEYCKVEQMCSCCLDVKPGSVTNWHCDADGNKTVCFACYRVCSRHPAVYPLLPASLQHVYRGLCLLRCSIRIHIAESKLRKFLMRASACPVHTPRIAACQSDDDLRRRTK